MRRLFLIGALALAASAAIAVAAFAGSGGRTGASAPPNGAGQNGPGPNPLAGINFVSVCDFSHMASDDPIVFPGQPGKSHHHTFVGNTSTDADSTLESLLAAGTTCQRPGDTAAYWVPTLLAGGEPVEPIAATVYYRRGTVQPVEAFPAGLRVIAGSAKAASPQSLRVTFWTCGARGQVPPSSEPPTCAGVGRGLGLRLHVRFPNCWDGVSLDSADHQSHMAYAERGRCPTSHPVEVPSLSLIVRYPVSDGDDVELASGGAYSAHADFFNAWDQAALERLVDTCLNALRRCGR